jgi:hypothetical protein
VNQQSRNHHGIPIRQSQYCEKLKFSINIWSILNPRQRGNLFCLIISIINITILQ